MNNNLARAVVDLINQPIVYGLAVLMTLLVIGYRYRWISLPRTVALLNWSAVVGLAIGWPLFYVLCVLEGDIRDIDLVSIVVMLTFLPVYVCALVLLFFYPRKPRIDAA